MLKKLKTSNRNNNWLKESISILFSTKNAVSKYICIILWISAPNNINPQENNVLNSIVPNIELTWNNISDLKTIFSKLLKDWILNPEELDFINNFIKENKFEEDSVEMIALKKIANKVLKDGFSALDEVSYYSFKTFIELWWKKLPEWEYIINTLNQNIFQHHKNLNHWETLFYWIELKWNTINVIYYRKTIIQSLQNKYDKEKNNRKLTEVLEIKFDYNTWKISQNKGNIKWKKLKQIKECKPLENNVKMNSKEITQIINNEITLKIFAQNHTETKKGNSEINKNKTEVYTIKSWDTSWSIARDVLWIKRWDNEKAAALMITKISNIQLDEKRKKDFLDGKIWIWEKIIIPKVEKP